MIGSVRPRVGISRCLIGDEVRYDGGHKHAGDLIAVLTASVELVPVCPEVEVGMGVPREPIQLVGRGGRRLVGVVSGEDWTERMQAWARRRIEELTALDLSGFVLKARSPSCGLRDVPVQDAAPGPGMFAEALVTALPELPVEDEERLHDPQARERFLARVLAYRAWHRSHQ